MLWTRIEAPVLRVGSLTVDRKERRVAIGARAIDLSPLLFRLLEHLVEHAGSVVTRAELKRVMWPYAERIDTERRLNTAMRALRAALDDDVGAPRYVETVRSHGYRWIANQRRLDRPKIALAIAAMLAFTFTLSPRATAPPADLTTALKSQNAMEQWRRQPNPRTTARAAAALKTAQVEVPSVLVMKAELELGSRWQWSAAERDYQRAIAEDPRNSDARLGLAWLRVNQGRRAEALVLVGDLLASEVASGDRRASLGWLLLRAGRPDLAAATCGQDAAASINDLSCSHEAFAALGRYTEAKAVALGLMGRMLASPAAVEQVRGRAPRQAYAVFLDWRAHHFLPADAPWFQKAQVLADAGDMRSALSALERSIDGREPMAVKIASTPSFTALRNDPRFERLVGAVKA